MFGETFRPSGLRSIVVFLGIFISTPIYANNFQLFGEFDLNQHSTIDIARDNQRQSEAANCRLLKSAAVVKSQFVCRNAEFLWFGPHPQHKYKSSLAQRNPLKIGSFNLLHMGNQITTYKQLDLVAEIMDQWDIVAALELKSIPKDSLINSHNNRLIDRIDQINRESRGLNGRTASGRRRRSELSKERNQHYANYVYPGYLQLLFALKERDPSWSLILTKEGQGQGKHQELSGYYYRGKVVKSISTRACKQGARGKKACLADTPRGKEEFLSRPGFIAGFESGDEKYSMVAVHTRFDPHDQTRINGDSVFARAKSYLKEVAQDTGSDFFLRRLSSMSRFFVSRLTELALTLDYMDQRDHLISDHNFILMGDFNLPTDNYLFQIWGDLLDHYLPGHKVYVGEKTSIAPANGLSEPYDHFVANPSKTNHCYLGDDHLESPSARSPKAFDFSKIVESDFQRDIAQRVRFSENSGRTLSEEDRVLKSLVDWVKEWRGLTARQFDRKLEDSDDDRQTSKDMRSFFGLTYDQVVDLQTLRRNRPEKLFTRDKIEKLRSDMYEKIISTDDDDNNPYWSVMQALSDHLPISMRCKADR